VRTLLVGLALAAGAWLVVIGTLFLLGRRSAARELATLIPNVVLLFRALLRDARVPLRTKWLVALGVAWLVSPIDLVPEFVPVVGPLDDAIVAALILRAVLRRTDLQIVAEHWRGDPATLAKLVGRRDA
jgi:uncharacterized membrane protein YkvA (DUF1232 family)